jgi:hypothetical protein
MVSLGMAETTKSHRRRQCAYTLGRKRFAKISAVEGIHVTPGMEEEFQEFERRGLSPEERRREILRKYGPKR